MSYVSNRPTTAPRAYQRYAIQSDLVNIRGFPVIDGMPIPINAEQLTQGSFIDTWRCEFDGTKATKANPDGELGQRTGKYGDGWKIIKKGIEVGDCYYQRINSKGAPQSYGHRYEIARRHSHSPIDYQTVGNRLGSFSGVSRSFGENNTSQWVIDRQQKYSDDTGKMTYKKVDGKVVPSTFPSLTWLNQFKKKVVLVAQ